MIAVDLELYCSICWHTSHDSGGSGTGHDSSGSGTGHDSGGSGTVLLHLLAH